MRASSVAGWSILAVGTHAAILAAPLLGLGQFGQFGIAAFHDVRIYFDYGSRVLAGGVPYRDYPVEYPPLALILFVLPRLAASRFVPYPMLFAAEMLIFDAAAVALLARRTAAREGAREVPLRLAWYTAAFGALYPVIGTRYDLAPAVIAFAGALAWFGERPAAGGLLTAAGTLLKIFPAVVAALGAIADLRAARTARAVLIFAGAMLAAGAAWFVLGGAASVMYHIGRGLQIETVWAGALLLADKALGVTPAWRYSRMSVELVAPGSSSFAALAIPAQVALAGAVVWRFARSELGDPLRYATAAVLALVVAGKVLSPQYLVWLLPFVSALGGAAGRSARPLFLAACVATGVEYMASRQLAAFELWAILALNVRNALLVALLIPLLRRLPEPEAKRSE